MSRSLLLRLLAGLAAVLLAGCETDYSLTAKPTRAVEHRLLGDWLGDDGETRLLIRQSADSTYIAVIDDDVYRAFHTDHAGLSLMAAQELDPAPGRFAHVAWKLSDDGRQLTLRLVRDSILEERGIDRVSLQRAIAEHRDHPDVLLLGPSTFTRRPRD